MPLHAGVCFARHRLGTGIDSQCETSVLLCTQDGEETQTVVRHFLLCGAQQLHDLHSKIILDHPRYVTCPAQ